MTRRTVSALAVAVLGATLLGACAGAPPLDEGVERAPGVTARTVALDDAGAMPDVVAATRRIGTVTLGHAPQDGDAVVSPASVAVALAMLTEGARGRTLTELESVLGAEGDARRDAFAALRTALAAYDGDPAVVQDDELPERPVLHLADQVVVHEDYPVSEEYLAALAEQFDAGIQRTDLTSPGATRVVDVETMSALVDVPYAEVDGWRAARLPYVEAFHTDVLLPPEGTDPASATPDLLAAVDAALDAATADLSGIGPEDLVVGQAFQQAVLLVDQGGTRAAAVTEIGAEAVSGLVAVQEVELHLDRPFLLTVDHTETSWPLFLAAVRDPRR
ncbi:serpin family protein [Isoptericola variabilis]|uniref:Proteinase inhibitor I4 serpin n=1 Tax=Isoptericola variabilis (strain 225) TaxID=743718 RepID=F6FQA3_ISOV2|nr:serpin family protein [Isoptericola variabilis]AEG42856.1 proteinase inhibitor I4 serpin [Isoptericola variabilis 225]TWH30996.1 Serine protease inhibitor [Isoptericola variabilis J7]